MLYDNRNNYSGGGANLTAIAGTAIAVGFVLFLFMPSVLDKIRNVTDIGRPKTEGARRLNDMTSFVELPPTAAEGVLEDTDNLGAV